MDLAEKILRRLDETGMTQAKLARLIGESPQRLNKWLQGIGQPKPDDLLALSRALELPLEYLADTSMDDPAGVVAPDEDEKAVLLLYRALGLGRDEALRRLARGGEPSLPNRITPPAGPVSFPPAGLKSGPSVPAPSPRTRRKRG